MKTITSIRPPPVNPRAMAPFIQSSKLHRPSSASLCDLRASAVQTLPVSTFDVGRSMFSPSSQSKIQNHQSQIVNPPLFPWASPSHHPPSKVSAVRANAC
jgi:hypothetical protein